MRVSLLLILVPALITITIPPAASEEYCTISGVAYDYLTLEPLPKTIIEVNTTPPQVYVSASGEYTLSLPPGTYHLIARHYENNVLEYQAEENITVRDGGDYRLDIIMLPAIEDDLLFDEPDISDLDSIMREDKVVPFRDLIIPILALLILIPGLILLMKLRGRRENAEESKAGHDKPLPADLLEIVEILRKNDGRMTQKDLRRVLPYSEAKISLMITDLEDRGIVKRIKKGRGNVIILENSR
ncbi:MAG TPA: hypothetical protein ENI32_01675 [Candidatus Syntrophoarchaeum butanivorans]|uniref:Membrane-associated protein/domain protein n=1 Tax=Candidatus Syntropharchaeum butanivorans TaxID=1839936 RepID=A0A1F2P3V3_9EURY|nr:MAG: membrane-associated protein/domain protein [Candidatus Syntrophoarchaeum butanivorans]HEC56585.1 hypothetical protein [Candidatus Syntrophoarchaeum butanivorans]